MRVVFMGTPDFAVPALEALASAHEVALVVTRPDAVRSRGKRLEPSPVKAAALALGLPVAEACRMTPEVKEALAGARADVFIVAAFGCILPDDVLEMAPLGCVNIHASLLPRWRGAAPIQRAILAGDDEAGVSIMRIGHGVDTGAFCAQASCKVGEKCTAELTSELARLGANLLVSTLPSIADGRATWTEQDEALVTHADKLVKGELDLDPVVGVEQNLRRVRAASDATPCRLRVADRSVRALAACAAPGGVGCVNPGSFAVERGRVFLGCVDGALELLELKPDGKRAMPASAWAAGLRMSEGTWERAS